MALKINGKTVGMFIPRGIIPTGKKTVTQNGTYDVTEFAEVEVDVPSSGDDVIAKQFTKTVAEIQDAGSYTLLSQQELVDAGFLVNTMESLYDKYTDVLVDIQLQNNVHRAYQLVSLKSSKKGFNYSGSSKYYKTGYRHSSNTSSSSAIQSNAVMTSLTTGFCNYSTSYGIYATLNSSYLLPAGATYSITLVAVK